MPHRLWKAQVADALERIEAGEFDKVVLARRVDITANRPFVMSDVLARLIALYPSCMVFSVDGFIGASPELLVARTGDQVVEPPAGRHGGPQRRRPRRRGPGRRADGVAEGQTGARVVIDVLREALQDVCVELDVPDRPSVMGLRNVSHLATRITGRLDPRTPMTALELVARIHPTPAVGGNPTRWRCPTCSRWRASTGAATPARWAGSTPEATGPGPSGSAPPRWTGLTPASSPATAW